QQADANTAMHSQNDMTLVDGILDDMPDKVVDTTHLSGDTQIGNYDNKTLREVQKLLGDQNLKVYRMNDGQYIIGRSDLSKLLLNRPVTIIR
ncbi:hypothetical protein ABTM42_19880, partial [Acinetobacter baumannii]